MSPGSKAPSPRFIQDIARVYAELQQAVASAERVFTLADSEPEVTDRPGAIDGRKELTRLGLQPQRQAQGLERFGHDIKVRPDIGRPRRIDEADGGTRPQAAWFADVRLARRGV